MASEKQVPRNEVLRTAVLDISYRLAGPTGGHPVVLVHGWPDAARGWADIASSLQQAGYRTVVPELRGSGGTLFLDPSTPRDGRGVALARDVLDLMDGLGIDGFSVVGHDWGARAAYTLAVLVPERISSIAALALAFQPGGRFTMPDFDQARAFWYQWLLYVDAGAAAVLSDPVGFARIQWDTWSPPGWFDDAEFATTAASFGNPDWAAVTLNAYRSRFHGGEPRDARYSALQSRLESVETVTVPTLMIQGGADFCDPPALSAGQERFFTGGYRRVVLDGVGHFPHREAGPEVAGLVLEHLAGQGKAVRVTAPPGSTRPPAPGL